MVNFFERQLRNKNDSATVLYCQQIRIIMHKLKFKNGDVVTVFYEALCSINWMDEVTRIKYSFEPYQTPQNELKYKVTAIKDGGIAPIVSGFVLRFEGDLLFMDAFSNSYKITTLNTSSYPCELDIESSFSAKAVKMRSYLK